MQYLSPLSIIFLGLVTAQMSIIKPETGIRGNATVVENNPPGATYLATFPGESGKVKGTVSATANTNGIGVQFQVNLSNLPKTGGPFGYHLHSAPLPPDGNCTGALGHLDPYLRGEITPCNSTLPQTCQVGDLSGKHGKITADPFIKSYTDEFASTTEGIGSYFGNRSIVIHTLDKTRIACANFTNLAVPVPAINETPTPAPGRTNETSPIPFEGSSSRTSLTLVTGFVALAHLVLLI